MFAVEHSGVFEFEIKELRNRALLLSMMIHRGCQSSCGRGLQALGSRCRRVSFGTSRFYCRVSVPATMNDAGLVLTKRISRTSLVTKKSSLTYDRKLRVGQSLDMFTVSRSHRHGLRPEQPVVVFCFYDGVMDGAGTK
jgi:hypothetical protein